MTHTFTTNGLTVMYDDNSKEVLAALKNAVERGLEAVGQKAVGNAVRHITEQGAVDTGILRNSIDSKVAGEDVYIGTNVGYAPYIELGTGKYSVTGKGTPKESWVYKDELGRWHMGHPMKARPFLVPAARDHTDEYKKLLKDSLENA